MKKSISNLKAKIFKGLLGLAMVFTASSTFAQGDVVGGIEQATSSLTGTFDSVANLILVIGGVVGLAGAIRVYIKWQNGDQDVQKHLIGWLGASIFLLAVGAILKSLYGIA